MEIEIRTLQVLLICFLRFRFPWNQAPRFFAPVTGLTLVRWSILAFFKCYLVTTIIRSVLPSLILSFAIIIIDPISLILRSIAFNTGAWPTTLSGSKEDIKHSWIAGHRPHKHEHPGRLFFFVFVFFLTTALSRSLAKPGTCGKGKQFETEPLRAMRWDLFVN